MKRRYIRPDDELRDDTVVPVRGGVLDVETMREDAVAAFDVYGVYALSVFALLGKTLDELAQPAPLVRFGHLTLMTVGALHAARLRLVPTGRRPLHYSVGVRRPGRRPRAARKLRAPNRGQPVSWGVNIEREEATVNDEQIDLRADLNAQDDDGNGWSLLSGARDPDTIKVGAMVLAGNSQAVAVARVVAVDDDGQVHFVVLPGPISKNRHLLDGASA